VNRRPYLDWLRGIAVLIMIEGHTLDSWTRMADRGREGYQWAIVLAGFGAPIFLFLAGLSLALAAVARRRKGLDERAIGAAAFRRGLWIFGLAFLFRLQSWIISGGPFPRTLLKVDILNVMGVSMMLAALLWIVGRRDLRRAALFAAATLVMAMFTPPVRDAAWLAVLPDPIEGYLRPAAGGTTFTLFPWAGFLTGGAALGLWLGWADTAARERQVNLALAALGVVVGFAGYWASFLPPIYEHASFWTSSPTFFFLRLGVLILAVPAAYACTRAVRAPFLEEFGRASLFVYWIHVEMVYGVLSTPLHRRLPFWAAVGAFALFSAFLFGLVLLKTRVERRGQSPEAGQNPSAAVVSAPRLS
jgi:uncharacterized membrane protein